MVLDTLSAFHLPKYGYNRDTAPFLTELAEENCFFPFAYSTAPWTPPSHASLFSGKLPRDHGCTTENIKFNADTFVEELNEEGYSTVAYSNNPLLSQELGFDRGFDTFLQGPQIYSRARGGPALIKMVEREKENKYSSTFSKYVDFAKEAIKNLDFSSIAAASKMIYNKLTGKAGSNLIDDTGAQATKEIIDKNIGGLNSPFFLFLNFMECHKAYGPPDQEIVEKFMEEPKKKEYYKKLSNKNLNWQEISDKDAREVLNLYDASIRYLDGKIKDIYEKIINKHPETTFIILADHGENLGDYGLWKHGYGVFEKLIRIPLIITGPEVPEQKIEENVSITDVREYILGEEDLDKIGTNPVFAEYHGSKEEESIGKNQRKKKILNNTSKAIVKGKRGLIEHSHLDDFSFKADKNSFKEKSEDIEGIEDLRDKLEDAFGVETQGIDI